MKFTEGQKVVRIDDEKFNKKWPKEFLNKPLRILATDGKRLWFDNLELVNDKGWVASRFMALTDERFNPLARFL